ncbi:outer membrane beta-barrel protein [Curvibacter sp. APW13]|uniref:outer membrane beta-barrel protein n=1 Tax=Curvibacter sp. APW13 TaxID=3077236 RepID=UPI0028DD56EE|nr:outer membrane beta-barrel protein [Curvibacter sp. APW13]MDT8992611.1 outer membrane beta-barrel protein [Curvibacter sp. APW13]
MKNISTLQSSYKTVASVMLSVALWGPTHAHAQINSTNSNLPLTYIGLSFGATDLSQSSNDFGLIPNSNRGHATQLNYGVYVPQDNFGFEIGYIDFGSASRSGGTTRAEGINLSLIGRLPLNEVFNLLGKIGTTYGHTNVSAAAGSGASTGTVDGFDWSYGIGAELTLVPSVSAVLQYDEHYLKFAGDHSNRVYATTLGLRYRY